MSIGDRCIALWCMIVVAISNLGVVCRTRKSSPLPEYCFEASKYIIPQDSKRDTGGEDAATCSPWHLAVADGVGGWSLVGIDAGQYSKGLISNIEDYIRSAHLHKEVVEPIEAITSAHKHTKFPGSSTCCLLTMPFHSPVVKSANIGDSGFVVYRPSMDRVIFKSAMQTRGFNYPLQLGYDQPEVLLEAACDAIPLNIDDIIIVATDGVWDNLYDEDLVGILGSSSSATQLAALIAITAYKYSQISGWRSPFNARQECEVPVESVKVIGGKKDDISVVVGIVRKGPLCHLLYRLYNQ